MHILYIYMHIQHTCLSSCPLLDEFNMDLSFSLMHSHSVSGLKPQRGEALLRGMTADISEYKCTLHTHYHVNSCVLFLTFLPFICLQIYSSPLLKMNPAIKR